MRLEQIPSRAFIRRHCGSVAIEAPSGRVTGAMARAIGPFSINGQSSFMCCLCHPWRGSGETSDPQPRHPVGSFVELRLFTGQTVSTHPAGEAFPAGVCLLRVINP